jgi:hypothetical protein
MLADGHTAIRAYVTAKGLVFIPGEPGGDHNCDAMGCNTMEHVIATVRLPADVWPIPLPGFMQPAVLRAAKGEKNGECQHTTRIELFDGGGDSRGMFCDGCNTFCGKPAPKEDSHA